MYFCIKEMIMKQIDIDFSFLHALIEKLVHFGYGASSDMLLDGHYVTFHSNSSEFVAVLVYCEAHVCSGLLAQFSFVPASKELYIGFSFDYDCGDALTAAFRRAIPDIVIKDNREELAFFAMQHGLDEWVCECAVGFVSPVRLDSHSLPEGLFQYDLRGSDEDDMSAASIESKVLVDHYGTIVVCAPLPVPMVLSVPYIPYNEEGEIDSGHSVIGRVGLLGSLKVGDRFHNDNVSDSVPLGVDSSVLDPCFPNLTVSSVNEGLVVAKDAFNGVHLFPSNKRVWVIPEIKALIS